MSLDAATAAREIAAANSAYLAGDYGGAIARYETALEAGADGGDLWFNFGNALYRAGEQGRAVLAFERALQRNPGDDGARQNLQLVRSQISGASVQAPSESFVTRVGARTDPDIAAALLVVCWSLACATWVVRRALGSGAARVVTTVLLVLLLAGATTAGAAAFASWQVRADGWAIVVRPGDVLRAPAPDAPRLFPAHEGLKLQSDRRIGGYAHVRLGDREGWIESSRIEMIAR